MKLIIDANVFAAYFRASIGKASPDMTADPSPIMKANPLHYQIILDDGKHVEHEWCTTTDPTWSKEWITSAIIEGRIRIQKASNCPRLKKTLANHGFPKSKDARYVQLLHAASRTDLAEMISEDMDFYQPNMKKSLSSNRRLKFLRHCKGELRKDLAQMGLKVTCVEAWLNANAL